MNLFISIESREQANPVQAALAQVFKEHVVDRLEDAELVVTNSPKRALRFLKESDNVRVVLSPMESSEDKAVTALAKAYGDRVIVRTIVGDDTAGLVPSLMALLGEEGSQ